jgi:DNA replication protein DnaC
MPHTATLPLLLKQRKLAAMARHWERLLHQATEEGWNPGEYLAALCEQELAERTGRRIARQAAESHLPAGKSLASFDFAQVPTLSSAQIEALASTSDGSAAVATSCCSAPVAWARRIWRRPLATA